MFWSHDCAAHGHKFEARYDYKGPVRVGEVEGSAMQAIEFMRALGDQTYVKDICVYCGQSIDRHPLHTVTPTDLG